MGALVPGSALGPPSTLAEIFRHICLQSHLQTSPQTPQMSYLKFRNPRTINALSNAFSLKFLQKICNLTELQGKHIGTLQTES